MLITLFAAMVVATLFWGSNLGWKQVLIFWAAFLLGGLIFATVFHVPRFATLYMGFVTMWFVGKAATHNPSLN